MLILRLEKAIRTVLGLTIFANSKDVTQDAVEDVASREGHTENPTKAQSRVDTQKRELENKQQKIRDLRYEWRATMERAEKIGLEERKERKKKLIEEKQDLFRLRRDLRTAKEPRAECGSGGRGEASLAADRSASGTLPDFIVIGAQKCGTSSFYHSLVRHPYVEPAVDKELHYFDHYFEEDTEWYKRCFALPRWNEGRRLLTGEATPKYLFDPPVPGRMVEVIPQVRLIVLLRNPVDRAYSHYYHEVRNGTENRSFEEAVRAEASRLRTEWNEVCNDTGYRWDYERSSYLARGIYIDQLLRWSKYFDKEQMLVLRSEDFFAHPQDTVQFATDFLDLPRCEPEEEKIRHRNKGSYERTMDRRVRRELESYFEPHNRRLFQYLDTDFGW